MSEGLDTMSTDQLIETLYIAADSVEDNIALSMLLKLAAERLQSTIK